MAGARRAALAQLLIALHVGPLARAQTITGSWSQGGASVPLTLTRFVPTAARPRVPKPSDIDGDWGGTLVPPAGSLRIVVHISTFEDGMSATMDSPDQGASGLPATSISRAARWCSSR